MKCWKCQKKLDLQDAKIGFRASCLHCGSDLHVCVNCRFYAPGKPNDCAVPGTEPIRDREAANFCEEFKVKPDTEPPKDRGQGFKSLFKDENP